MNQAILDKIRKVEPYVPGEQPKEHVISSIPMRIRIRRRRELRRY